MNDILFNFANKNVLVMGGSKGIGRSICKSFIDASAKSVTSIARTKCDIQHVANVICDISDNDKLKKALETLIDIDILINVAGTNLCEGIDKINDREWDRVMNTNLKSFFMSIKHFSKFMKVKKYGKIVNVSSIAGRNKSIVSGIHYTASKHGIIGLTKQSAQELGRHGINVNCTCPSQTLTEMLKSSMDDQSIKLLNKNIPLGRISSTAEQALPVLFLCSSAASYINGAVLDINGGQF